MKEKMLARVKWFTIGLDISVIITMGIILIVDPDSLEKANEDKMEIVPSLTVRIYQIVTTTLLYTLLATSGTLLLRQIKQYFTETPRYLVISQYVILMTFTFALGMVGLQMGVEEMYTPEIL